MENTYWLREAHRQLCDAGITEGNFEFNDPTEISPLGDTRNDASLMTRLQVFRCPPRIAPTDAEVAEEYLRRIFPLIPTSNINSDYLVTNDRLVEKDIEIFLEREIIIHPEVNRGAPCAINRLCLDYSKDRGTVLEGVYLALVLGEDFSAVNSLNFGTGSTCAERTTSEGSSEVTWMKDYAHRAANYLPPQEAIDNFVGLVAEIYRRAD